MSFKIGIIGAGKMLSYQVKGFFSAGAEIICITDPNTEVAREASIAHGISRIYQSVEEMFAEISHEIDAVSILAPPASHKELVMKALAARKHVLCEKPPALNAGEVAEMRSASEAAKKILVFNFNNRLRPEAVAIRERIVNGLFGRINAAQAVWVRRSGIPGYGSWFTDRRIAGGGALIDLVHIVDLALYFMGYPEPTCVLGQTFFDFMCDPTRRGAYGRVQSNGPCDVESSAHAFVTFRTGQTLFVRTAWAEMVEKEECFVAFQGERAGGRILRLFGKEPIGDVAVDTCEIYTQDNGRAVNSRIPIPYDAAMGRIAAAAAFVDLLEGKKVPLATPDEALRLMHIVDAIYRSAETRLPITFNSPVTTGV